MSENIYEETDYSNVTKAGNKTETTNANVEWNASRQNIQLSKIQDSPGGRNYGCYKLAVVLLGLLCVLFVAVIAGQCIMARQLQLRYNNLLNENDLVWHEEQMYMEANLTNIINDLEARNNNLIRQNKQLQVGSTTLTAEKSQLETNFRAMTGEKDELQRRLGKLESMMQVKCHAVDVTLDPDTAHASLILSADGKQVSHGDKAQNVPDSPKRFSPVVNVLGKHSFSSGRFYYEVQVKGKTEWALGVARESITRKGETSLGPENGYWTIWLSNGNEYEALASPSIPLSLKGKLQKVGVFVDYEAGLVSFYDADSWFPLYSYNNTAFTEPLYPYFSPCLNDGGVNSSPLIITSVSVCPI